MTYVSWQKGEKRPLSPHFSTHEFSCSCTFSDCTTQHVAQELIDKLELVRAEYGKPLQVTSGFRCHKYQELLKAQGYQTATGLSDHEVGHAADIKGGYMSLLVPAAEKHFKSIGLAKTWLHVDLRSDKERRWYYK